MFWFCTFAFQGKTRTLLEALSWSFGIYLEWPDSEAKTADPLWTEGPSGGSLDLQILCESVYEAIQRENRQASRLEPHDARQIDRPPQPAPAPAYQPTPEDQTMKDLDR